MYYTCPNNFPAICLVFPLMLGFHVRPAANSVKWVGVLIVNCRTMTLVRTIGLRINIWLLRANHPDKLRDVEVEGIQGHFVAPAVQGIEQKCDINIGMMDLKV